MSEPTTCDMCGEKRVCSTGGKKRVCRDCYNKIRINRNLQQQRLHNLQQQREEVEKFTQNIPKSQLENLFIDKSYSSKL